MHSCNSALHILFFAVRLFHAIRYPYFFPLFEGHLLPAPWQAVLDESSGYHYYWNCETNEVQWEPPPAPAVQGCPLPEPPPPPLTDDNADKDENGIEQEQGISVVSWF